PGAVSRESLHPAFRIFAPRENGYEALTTSFEEALQRVRIGGNQAKVTTLRRARRWPPGLPPIFPIDEAEGMGCVVYGLEVAPIFRDPRSGDPFPRVANELRRDLSLSLRQFFYEFARESTAADPEHFHVLGRRAAVKAVWEVDAKLAAASEAYDFLLQLTPVNHRQAWNQFERGRFQRMPTLRYRPLLVDPVVLKRQLFRVPVERIEDPALATIFREKLYELDRQVTMLQDRNTHRFLHESIQLYGGVTDVLHDVAMEILERIPPRSREFGAANHVDAQTFAQRAREEIELLRAGRPEVEAKVEVRPDVTGLLASQGNLLVPKSREEALIQHEDGTHILTYHNGRSQKLRILAVGLSGYDALQEGLAVLSEYLVGGLSRPRLRLLAGRVLAARYLLEGATFIDTFRELWKTYGFARRTAFAVTVRTYRSGGLTKDAVYLLGLRQILEYLEDGGELEPLFVGKIAAEHIPVVRELTWRGVLVPPPMVPRYMLRSDSLARLERVRRGVGPLGLLDRSSR
ncbi:MAG: DUF1704 domain-containing protein, partial [Gemmatimonadota bacterium]